MDDSSLSNVIGFLLLIALHAIITLAYAALVNTRQTHLREQAESGNPRAQQALHLTDGSTRLHITYQLSIILVRFAIAAWTTVNLAQPFLAANPMVNPFVGYALLLILAACLTLILGEIVPESVGSVHAQKMALWSAAPMHWLIVLLSPVVLLSLAVSRALSAAFGSSQLINTITEEEIMTLVDAGHTDGTIEEEEKDMIYSVLQLDQTYAREVMVPRIDIMAVEIETPLDDAIAIFTESGFSRIPVYEDTIDNIKGLLYAKDLLTLVRGAGEQRKSIRELMRPAYFVPENKRADVLLKELQNQKVHIAVVVDEYGGTAGLVTIENLIEEIIGDIQDEYDVNEEAEYVEHGPDEYMVDASMDLDDFNELLDVELPTEESDTLGGFIYTQLGRVPEVGETVESHNLVMQIRSIDGRRIRKVHIIRKREQPPVEDAPVEEDAAASQPQQITGEAGI